MMALIALVALALLGGGGFFGYRWWARRKAAAAAAAQNPAQPAAPQDDDDDAAPSGGEEGGSPAVMVLKQLIVNLDSAHKNAFLKCELNILFNNQELGKLATSDKPTPENSIIRAIILQVLSGKTVEEASDVETREAIRQEIKDKLNEKFANRHSKEELAKAKKTGRPPRPPIKDVLVTDWAIQQ